MTTRVMVPADIRAGLDLCRHNGWNQLARDWELFLRESPQGCRVAINDSYKVIGTATTIRYEFFSWIGMMLIDPANQRQGIGQQLLGEVLEVLKNEPTVRLDATPSGRILYLKHGFTDEFELSRMHIKASQIVEAAQNVQQLQAADHQQLFGMDNAVFGCGRKVVLEWIIQGSPELAFVVRQNGKLTGFSLGRQGHRFTQIGPVMAMAAVQAIELVKAALAQCQGEVILDVPYGGKLQQWLLQNGFTEMRRLIRMQRGEPFKGGDLQKQFAILGPELG